MSSMTASRGAAVIKHIESVRTECGALRCVIRFERTLVVQSYYRKPLISVGLQPFWATVTSNVRPMMRAVVLFVTLVYCGCG